MTGFDFGDVVLVPFPFTDQSTIKKRPAVVVSSARYNSERPDVIIMAITSQLRSESPFDVPVIDWQSANLLKPSAIKPLIATVEQRLILKRLGALTPRDLQAAAQGLKQLLGGT
jgi:mRNA interferase MazF